MFRVGCNSLGLLEALFGFLFPGVSFALSRFCSLSRLGKTWQTTQHTKLPDTWNTALIIWMSEKENTLVVLVFCFFSRKWVPHVKWTQTYFILCFTGSKNPTPNELVAYSGKAQIPLSILSTYKENVRNQHDCLPYWPHMDLHREAAFPSWLYPIVDMEFNTMGIMWSGAHEVIIKENASEHIQSVCP